MPLRARARRLPARRCSKLNSRLGNRSGKESTEHGSNIPCSVLFSGKKFDSRFGPNVQSLNSPASSLATQNSTPIQVSASRTPSCRHRGSVEGSSQGTQAISDLQKRAPKPVCRHQKGGLRGSDRHFWSSPIARMTISVIKRAVPCREQLCWQLTYTQS